jgi:hypothetical protein
LHDDVDEVGFYKVGKATRVNEGKPVLNIVRLQIYAHHKIPLSYIQ